MCRMVDITEGVKESKLRWYGYVIKSLEMIL